MMPFLKMILHRSSIRRRTALNDAGVTLVELLAAVAITGVLAAIAAPSISTGNAPLKDSTNRVTANVKLIRAKAMSQTSAYRIRPISVDQLIIERAANCNAVAGSWVRDAGFADEDLELSKFIGLARVTVNGTNVTPVDGEWSGTWSICFNSRGMANGNVVMTLGDISNNSNNNEPNQLQIFPGGTVQLASVVQIPPTAPAGWAY
jgi:prepilin-type N-terminal cleavage/methylation domain-containing protein